MTQGSCPCMVQGELGVPPCWDTQPVHQGGRGAQFLSGDQCQPCSFQLLETQGKISAHPVGKAEKCSANGQHTRLGTAQCRQHWPCEPRAVHSAIPPLCQVPSEDISRRGAEHVCQVTVVPSHPPPPLPFLAKTCSILPHDFIPSQDTVIPCQVLVEWLHPTLHGLPVHLKQTPFGCSACLCTSGVSFWVSPRLLVLLWRTPKAEAALQQCS